MKKYIIAILILLIGSQVWGANIYVDATCAAGAAYDVATRTQGTGSDPSYQTVAAAVAAMASGDDILIRGGTYTEGNIYINPSTQSGTSGNWSSIRSYPGEWAILDGENSSSRPGFRSESYQGYNWPTSTKLNHFIFERFEVKGFQDGFWLVGGPITFRYMSIHDNTYAKADDGLKAGIFIGQAEEVHVEYCYIYNNNNNGTPTLNNSNIIFDGDQKDTSANGGEGGTFEPTQCVKKNHLRYNYIAQSSGGTSVQNFRHKGDQRFGQNSRNPDPSTGDLATYKDYGDEFDHNIFLNGDLLVCQDMAQVHNNIMDNGKIHLGKDHNVPQLYDMVAYNNTILCTQWSMAAGAGYSEHTADDAFANYYGSSTDRLIHPWVWMYNNISADSGSLGDYPLPFKVAEDLPANIADITWDMSNAVLDRNLINDAAYQYSEVDYTFATGHDYPSSGCGYFVHTTAQFNTCSDAWRSLSSGTVKNWENDDEPFVGVAGADKYRTSGTYVVSGSTTISDGGIGGSHPYLSATLPSYIGATNPSDDDWVAGVLAMDATYFTSVTAGSDPTWIEGADASSTGLVNGGLSNGTITN